MKILLTSLESFPQDLKMSIITQTKWQLTQISKGMCVSLSLPQCMYVRSVHLCMCTHSVCHYTSVSVSLVCASVHLRDFSLMWFSSFFGLCKGGSKGVESRAADFSSQNTGLSVLQVHPVERECCCQSNVAVGRPP